MSFPESSVDLDHKFEIKDCVWSVNVCIFTAKCSVSTLTVLIICSLTEEEGELS